MQFRFLNPNANYAIEIWLKVWESNINSFNDAFANNEIIRIPGILNVRLRIDSLEVQIGYENIWRDIISNPLKTRNPGVKFIQHREWS